MTDKAGMTYPDVFTLAYNYQFAKCCRVCKYSSSSPVSALYRLCSIQESNVDIYGLCNKYKCI